MYLPDARVLDVETVGEAHDGRVTVLGIENEFGEPHAYIINKGAKGEIAAPAFITHTKYDVRFLRLNGWTVPDVPIYDTQVMAWVLNENQDLKLESLVLKYTGAQMDKRITRSANILYFRRDDGKVVPLEDAPPNELALYNMGDLKHTRNLFNALCKMMDETSWRRYYETEELPFTSVLTDMECAGVPIDLQASEEFRAEVEVTAANLKVKLMAEGGLPEHFNIGSGDQLAPYLFSKVFELKDSLELGDDVCAMLKACQKGDHDECDVAIGPDGREGWEPVRHIVDLLPAHFQVTSVGRLKVHGVWTLRGRGLPPTENAERKARPSTSRNALTYVPEVAGDPWVQSYLEWRRVDKLLTTYLRKFPRIAVKTGACGAHVHDYDIDPTCKETDRIYGRFNQTGTKTGRLSSSNPNMQNQPVRGELGHRLRDLFRGNLIIGDYSQLEPRIMAHFSGDPVLTDAYRTGKDVYLLTAQAIFGTPVDDVEEEERGISKTVFLGSQYGARKRKVAQILALNGYPTALDRTEEYLRELEKLYSTLFAWKQAIMDRVKVTGYVTTIGGRHRRLGYQFKEKWNWRQIGYGERQAVNAEVQGSAGDIVRRMMMRWPNHVDAALAREIWLILQVHDELGWEHDAEMFFDDHGGQGSENRADLLRGLQDAGENGHGFDLSVPLVFEPHFGTSWAAAKAGDTIELPDEEEDDDE